MKGIGKRIALNFIVGAGFIASILVVNVVLVAITLAPLTNAISDLGGIAQGNIMLTVVALISLGITGVLIYVWVMARRTIAHYLGVTVTTMAKMSHQHKIAYVLTFVGVGALWWIALFGFTEFVSGVTDVNVLDLSTLISGDPVSTGVAIIGLVFLGLIVTLLGRAFSPTMKVMDTVTRNH